MDAASKHPRATETRSVAPGQPAPEPAGTDGEPAPPRSADETTRTPGVDTPLDRQPRPARGAAPETLAAWLLQAAQQHDTNARTARLHGDIPRAIEAEVLAARARTDAADLLDGQSPGVSPGSGGPDGMCRTPPASAATADVDRTKPSRRAPAPSDARA